MSTLAHPLNYPVIDENERVRRGFVVLQPRVNIGLTSAQASRYSRLLSGDVGIDPYTRVVSDVYQDLFTKASFIGKGIYHVDGFRKLLEGRFASNTILSHDLLESLYARTALVSDVELLEEHPSRYLADANRRHRWVRGDWQIAPFLGRTVLDGEHRKGAAGVGPRGRWKSLDNLRRSLVPAAVLLTFVVGWMLAARPGLWSLWILGAWAAPDLLPFFNDVLSRSRDVPWHIQFTSAAQDDEGSPAAAGAGDGNPAVRSGDESGRDRADDLAHGGEPSTIAAVANRGGGGAGGGSWACGGDSADVGGGCGGVARGAGRGDGQIDCRDWGAADCRDVARIAGRGVVGEPADPAAEAGAERVAGGFFAEIGSADVAVF